MNWLSEAPLVVKKVAAVESGPTKLNGPLTELLTATWNLMAVFAGGCSIEDAARLYFRLSERLSLAALGSAAHKLPREGQWPSQAAIAMLDELAALHADLLGSVLRAAGPQAASDPDTALGRWSASRKLALERVDRLKEELASAGQLDLAMLSVATSELRSLV